MDPIEYGKKDRSEPGSEWRDSHTLVILTAGACLLALGIALNNILDVPLEQAYHRSGHLHLYTGGSGNHLSSGYTTEVGFDHQSSRALDSLNCGHYHDYHRHECCLMSIKIPKKNCQSAGIFK